MQDNKAREILSDITVYMKYAKYMPEQNRKETWLELCQRNNMDGQSIMRSVKDLSKYPLISRKKIANRIAKIIDKFTKKEIL